MIRSVIDGLPFNKEGYLHAIKYLFDKYAHLDEIAGVYVINLLEMPVVTERDVARTNKFYEKLLFQIESLETFGKLDTVQRVTYYVIDVKYI